ncbi:Sirohydrochlorin ferrochelatase [Fervidicola ferrireducens]|uniref:Sirohydrochlorin ferrochelatase n=1 Tax=Fervidicola ferrireducens TaxID=520764 RepID=A0A140LB18_9FIRM|nr:CbiX/SirB N-terminal domain-containing protein [Fervidicola ferrireducens]KXG77743.1 Sirohydrochlorin ferrochelatase [Fervidicola ferrireducens]
MKALLLVAHGSREGDCARVMEKILEKVKSSGDIGLAEVAYVQFQRPTIEEAVRSLAGSGAKEIWAVPFFLFEGVHVKCDIPHQLKEAGSAYPDVRILLTRPLGYDEKLVDIIFERLAGEKANIV